MICTNCNSEIKIGKKFCGVCGIPAPTLERRCGACNTKLDDDENFCPECGVKYGESNIDKPQTPSKTEVDTSSVNCYNTTKGQMAVIGDTIFFQHEGKIYRKSMKDNQKAKLLLDRRNFIKIKYEDENEDYSISNLHNLNAWNGKLYFYASMDCYGDEKSMFREHNPEGIFCYYPKINKIGLVDEFWGKPHIVGNKAYYCRTVDKEEASSWRESISEKYGRYSAEREKLDGIDPVVFVTLDLETKERIEEFMPILALEDWPDLGSGEEDGTPTVETDWYAPFYNNGYLYTSVCGASAPLRYPVGNLEKYQFLKSGLSPCWDGVLSHVFASCGDVIIMYNWNHHSIDFFSNTTLEIIRSIPKYFGDPNWQTYGGNYFVFNEDEGDKKTVVYKIDEAKLLGSVDPTYSKMLDAITINNIVYALGDLYLEDEYGEEVYDDLALYRIPWNKMFKADTNLTDLGQPLFENKSEF